MTVYLVEIDYYDPTVPGLATLRLASNQGYNHPSAPGFYWPDLEQPASLTRSVWSTDDDWGAGKMALGDLVAGNFHARYDFLTAHGCSVAGRTARLLAVEEDAAYSTAVALFTGTMDGYAVGTDTATFRWRDRTRDLLDKPVQQARYGGTNTLPDGVDGTADDIKDAWLPELFGNSPSNFRPILVNTSRWIYQISRRAIADVLAVYDKGGALTKGSQRADVAALQANTPAAASFDYCLGTGTEGAFVRLGSQPAGDVTCDAVAGASSADRTIAQIWRQLMVEAGGATLDQVSAADIAALDAAQPGEVGIWVGSDEVKVQDAVNQIAGSCGAVTWQDTDGTWRIRQIAAPVGPAAAVFRLFDPAAVAQAGDGDILEIERQQPDADADAPAYSVTLNYAYNATVQSRDALTGVGLVRLQWVSQQWRQRTAVDAAVQTVHLNARALTQDTLFADGDVTAAEAARRQALLGDWRGRWRLLVVFGPATAQAAGLLSTVQVIHPRLGLAAGRLALVLGVDYDVAAGTAELTVWM